MANKIFFPVCLDLSGKKIVFIGGGKVALHKFKSLELYQIQAEIIAPIVMPEFNQKGCIIRKKHFEPEDLDGAFLVYTCTDDPVINQTISEECRKRGILVNITDNSELSDFISPAIFKKDNMSAAVSSNGKDVKKSIDWRNRIRELFK